MWQLEAHGDFAPAHDAGEPVIDGASPPESAPQVDALVVRFAGYADGRGFSTARRLRALGFAGRLVAEGPLAPDQARHAFQCGFDAVRVADDAVSRHGEAAWRRALTVSPGALYVADPTSRAGETSLWHRRHGTTPTS